MDDGSRTSIILILILLLLSAYFAVTETALSSVSRSRIKNRADKGDGRAGKALLALDDFDRAITTILIGTNVVHIVLASMVTVLVTRRWGVSAVTLSTILTTIVVFFAGEMVPKSIGKKNSEKCILASAGLLVLLMKVLYPLSALLSAIGRLAARLTREEAELTVTEDELYDMIEDLEEQGAIDEEQSDLISSALQFSDLTADSILTPRVDMVAINAEDDPEKIFELIRSTTHSRVPVYENTRDNIIGVLTTREYMKAYLKNRQFPELTGLCDPVYFTYQTTPIAELLESMSRKKVSLAVINDSYGGTLGIVTIEDILEELVGEIWDEDDKVVENIVKLDDRTFVVEAEETVEDALEELGLDPLTEEEEEEFPNLQVGEWVYRQFSEIPRVGDSFHYGCLTVTVNTMEKNRIRYVRFVLEEDRVPVPHEQEVKA